MMILIITLLSENHNPVTQLPLAPRMNDRVIVQYFISGNITRRHIYQAVNQDNSITWQEVTA